jgi:electron transport complex protein RnfD
MLKIIIALIPAVLMGIYFFGLVTIKVILLAILFTLIWEALCKKIVGRPLETINLSAVVWGLLLALALPPSAPWWLIAVGTLVMVILGKELYGGYGNNPFSGVLVAWVVLQMSFPALMNNWTPPPGDLMTMSTPLEVFKNEGPMFVFTYHGWGDLLWGSTAGYIGEVSSLMLLLGGVYLIWQKVISWRIPISFLAGILFFSAIFWLIDPQTHASPLFHLFAGGTFFVAFFLATDFPSSPTTPKGMLLYGFLAGVLALIIRMWGEWTSGAYYAVFLISLLTPFLDKITPRVYGR